mmetsp:Transcript_19887/g.45167  ORF Transcript_19887/g.45167 Transcript_19887/m.45167 type:complete len:254 (+) Transcript_19887:1189-1950(+)
MTGGRPEKKRSPGPIVIEFHASVGTVLPPLICKPLFVEMELVPKSVVGTYHRSTGLTENVGIVPRLVHVFHEVGDYDRGRSADSHVAVNQYGISTGEAFVHEGRRSVEIDGDIRSLAVGDGNVAELNRSFSLTIALMIVYIRSFFDAAHNSRNPRRPEDPKRIFSPSNSPQRSQVQRAAGFAASFVTRRPTPAVAAAVVAVVVVPVHQQYFVPSYYFVRTVREGGADVRGVYERTESHRLGAAALLGGPIVPN